MLTGLMSIEHAIGSRLGHGVSSTRICSHTKTPPRSRLHECLIQRCKDKRSLCQHDDSVSLCDSTLTLRVADLSSKVAQDEAAASMLSLALCAW